jgi:hypothetical protein
VNIPNAGFFDVADVGRIQAARRTLEDAGLFMLFSKHHAGSQPQLFALTRVNAGLSAPSNVTTLPNAQRTKWPRT